VIIGRIGLKATMVTGLGITAAGLLWYSRLSPDGSFLSDLLGPSLLTAGGAALAFIGTTIGATNGAAEHEAGLASGLINTTQQIGAALGLGVLVAAATARTESVVSGGEQILGVALTEGYRAGILVAAGIALLSALVAATLFPGRPSEPTPVPRQREHPAELALEPSYD
jgi:hypothetical protein